MPWRKMLLDMMSWRKVLFIILGMMQWKKKCYLIWCHGENRVSRSFLFFFCFPPKIVFLCRGKHWLMKTNCSRPNPVNYWALFFSPPIIGFLFTGDKCFWLNHWSFLKELDDNMIKKILWDSVFLSSTFTFKNLKSQHSINTLREEIKREGGKMQGELFRQ